MLMVMAFSKKWHRSIRSKERLHSIVHFFPSCVHQPSEVLSHQQKEHNKEVWSLRTRNSRMLLTDFVLILLLVVTAPGTWYWYCNWWHRLIIFACATFELWFSREDFEISSHIYMPFEPCLTRITNIMVICFYFITDICPFCLCVRIMIIFVKR